MIGIEEPLLLRHFNLTCEASLHPKVATQLIQYMVLEWVGPNEQSLGSDVSVNDQQTFYDTATQSLLFSPLSFAHGGDYTCRANLVLPDSQGTLTTDVSYHLNVLSKIHTN